MLLSAMLLAAVVQVAPADRVYVLPETPGPALLADAPPPPAMTLFKTFGPISTMTWSLDVVGLPDADDDGWRLLRTRAETIGDGYSTQEMHLWDAKGRPLILARQNVAVFV